MDQFYVTVLFIAVKVGVPGDGFCPKLTSGFEISHP